jgi:hypothetical protein
MSQSNVARSAPIKRNVLQSARCAAQNFCAKPPAALADDARIRERIDHDLSSPGRNGRCRPQGVREEGVAADALLQKDILYNFLL